MGQQPLLPHNPSNLTPTGELKVPSLSPERKETLEFMNARINAFAEHLFAAHTIFCETKKRVFGSQESKAAIFTAKQHVEGAQHELDSTRRLIDLNPHQVSHIAARVHRVSHQLYRIKNLTELVLRATRTTHHSRALDVLALACPRASYELESSVAAPLKEALRTPNGNEEKPPPPALTS